METEPIVNRLFVSFGPHAVFICIFVSSLDAVLIFPSFDKKDFGLYPCLVVDENRDTP
ncbi:MAG: hypothetical protein LKK13_00820 [Bacilli bacterium]|nr:hypothetical protein [Bacilli bacterium]